MLFKRCKRTPKQSRTLLVLDTESASYRFGNAFFLCLLTDHVDTVETFYPRPPLRRIAPSGRLKQRTKIALSFFAKTPSSGDAAFLNWVTRAALWFRISFSTFNRKLLLHVVKCFDHA